MDRTRTKGRVLLGALVSGALAAATLGGTPTANATCASFFGIGNSTDCTSNLTSIAIAIGTGAHAYAAQGLFGAAFAVGTDTAAETDPGFGGYKGGLFNLATAVGGGSFATAAGIGSLGVVAGKGSFAGSGGVAGDLANVAVTLGNGSDAVANEGIGNLALNAFRGGNSSVEGSGGQAYAFGNGNIAVNLGGNGLVGANGIFNNATSLFSTGNTSAGNNSASIANWAFNVFGTNNAVIAEPGPLAIAGSIGQTNTAIEQSGPGININGKHVIGGAAAVGKSTAMKPAAAATATRTTASKR